MIKMYLGPMRSGKSSRLIGDFERLQLSGEPYIVFQPSVNLRDGCQIKSRSGAVMDSNVVDVSRRDWIPEMFEQMRSYQNIGIDEFFMFPFSKKRKYSLVDVLKFFGRDRKIIISSLDLDFKGEPFPIVRELLPYADEVIKLTAVCHFCKEPATRSQKYLPYEGKWIPADYDSKEMTIEGTENVRYSPVCENHHKVPGRPLLKIPFS